jgi:hypothetical protein
MSRQHLWQATLFELQALNLQSHVTSGTSEQGLALVLFLLLIRIICQSLLRPLCLTDTAGQDVQQLDDRTSHQHRIGRWSPSIPTTGLHTAS